MSDASVAGPLFISVGRPDQLATFLELNPELSGAKVCTSHFPPQAAAVWPRHLRKMLRSTHRRPTQALIDDSPDFAGYKAAGFNYLSAAPHHTLPLTTSTLHLLAPLLSALSIWTLTVGTLPCRAAAWAISPLMSRPTSSPPSRWGWRGGGRTCGT